MNRAERRRQQKAGIKVTKEPTLNLKVSDFVEQEFAVVPTLYVSNSFHQ